MVLFAPNEEQATGHHERKEHDFQSDPGGLLVKPDAEVAHVRHKIVLGVSGLAVQSHGARVGHVVGIALGADPNLAIAVGYRDDAVDAHIATLPGGVKSDDLPSAHRTDRLGPKDRYATNAQGRCHRAAFYYFVMPPPRHGADRGHDDHGGEQE